MTARVWIIGVGLAAVAAAAGVWWAMKPATPRVYAEINEVPAGGIVLDDIDDRWVVSLPEGWRFKVTRKENWGAVRAIGPGTDVRLLNDGYARKRGETLCEVFTNWGGNTDKTQADENAGLPAKLARAIEFVKDGDPGASGMASAESETIDGIGTLTTFKAGPAEPDGNTTFYAKREAYKPVVALWAHCTTVLPTSASGYANDKALKEIIEVTRSFRPRETGRADP